MNFYPFHIGDYISHTSHLTDAEDLAYRRMIDLYYQSEQPFESAEKVARKVRSTPEIVQTLLGEFFVQDEQGLWHSPRADEEIAKYHAMQAGGRLGAQKRWGNAKDKGSDSPPKHPPMQTKNQEPRTKNHINTPEGVSVDLWNEFLAHRKKHRAQVTPRVVEMLKKQADLAKMPLSEVLEMCIFKGWRSFDASWVKKENTVKEDKSWMMSNQGIEAKARELGVNDYGVANHQQLKEKVLLVMAKRAMQ
jgi:uncharacterized protein YdaU (DUF1376 family)